MKQHFKYPFPVLLTCFLFILILCSLICTYGDSDAGFYLYYDDNVKTLDCLRDSVYHKRYEAMKSRASAHQNDPEYFMTIATYSALLDKFEECRLFIEKAFDANPEKANYIFENHNYLGSMFAEIYKTDDAAEELRIIRRAYPGACGAFDLTAFIFNNLRDTGKTEKSFMGEFANHTCTDSIVAMGHLLIEEKNPDYALKVYKTGMYFDPGCSYLVTSSAIASIEAKDYTKAREFINTAIKMNPYWGMNYVVLGNINVLETKYEAGLDNYYKSLVLDTRRQENGFEGIGNAYLKMARQTSDLLPPGWVIVVVVVLITVFAVCLNFLIQKKYLSQVEPSMAKKIRFESIILLFFMIIVNSTLVYFLTDKDSAIYRRTHQKSVYLAKSEYALRKAVNLNSGRSDFYVELSDILKLRGKLWEAMKIDKLLQKLPPPDIRQKLYIIY